MKAYRFPPGYNFIQSIERTYKQVKDPIGSMQESMARFDGTYSVYLGTTRFIITQDPDFIDYVLKVNHKNYYKSPLQTDRLGKFIGKGLLTSNGSYWLKQRRLIQPGFHAKKIEKLYSIIKQVVDNFLANFPTGPVVDVYPLMNRLSFELVIDTLFNIKVSEAIRSELSHFIFEAQHFLVKDIRQPHKRLWYKVSGEEQANLKRATRAREIIRTIIRQRKESNEACNDLLDMLLEARYDDTGEGMDEEQIIDEILILIVAGHETTANALSWTLYLLAKHRAELLKLRIETQDFDTNQSITSESLNNVINESMRLYPPAWISDRIALKDDSFKHYTFPANTIILLFYFGLHRDELRWSDPLRFQPDRFLKSNENKERTKAYYPFGGGPRLCIGNNFAMAEMTIFLQSFIKAFDFFPGKVEPTLRPLVTLKPDQILLEIKRRG